MTTNFNYTDPLTGVVVAGPHSNMEREHSSHTITTKLDSSYTSLYPAGVPLLADTPMVDECIHVSIPPAYCSRLFGEAQPFSFHEEVDDSFVCRLVNTIYEAAQTADSALIDRTCTSLLIHLNTVYATPRVVSPKSKLSSTQLSLICEYIHARLNETVSMTQLCALVGFSRFYFGRLFKRTLGITPHQYILRAKVEYAKSFMKKRKGAILDAAYKLSFADHAHFTNTFRRLTGITPRSFLASA